MSRKNPPSASTAPAPSAQEKLELRRRAASFSASGAHDEAADILRTLLSWSPRNPLIWNDLGVELEAAGRIDDAVSAWREGRALEPKYPPTLYNLGRCLLNQLLARSATGRRTPASRQLLSETIALLNANLDNDPENADSHQLLALAHELDGDDDLAAAHRTVAERLTKGL